MTMKRFLSFHYLWKIITLVVDGILLYLAFVVAYRIRSDWDPITYLNLFPVPPLNFSWSDYFSLIVPITMVWLVIFFFSGLYHIEKTKELGSEIRKVFTALNTGIVVYVIVTFFKGEQLFSRLIIVYAWILSFIFVILGRALLRKVRKFLRRYGYGIKNVLVIGTDQVAQQLLEGFRQKDMWNYHIIGVISGNGMDKKELCSFPIIGNLNAVGNIIKKHDVGEVLLTLSSLDHEKVLEIINFCKQENIRFSFIPDMLQLLSSYNTADMINGLPLITLRQTPLQGFNSFLKRVFDIVVSCLLLIILSPLFLLIALVVKLSSRGPIFIRQERVGMDGVVFGTIKFRTMDKDAEGKNGQYWTIDNDPRVTPIGKWLRKLNVDELPQLFNVIRGEMSLVGPRPEQPRFVKEFKEDIPRYMDRYHVKAGMTGWAQVNGWRGDTSIEERVRYDIYYLENWSLWFDIKILLKTFFSFGR